MLCHCAHLSAYSRLTWYSTYVQSPLISYVTCSAILHRYQRLGFPIVRDREPQPSDDATLTVRSLTVVAAAASDCFFLSLLGGDLTDLASARTVYREIRTLCTQRGQAVAKPVSVRCQVSSGCSTSELEAEAPAVMGAVINYLQSLWFITTFGTIDCSTRDSRA